MGATGIEPVTLRVWGVRSEPAELSARTVSSKSAYELYKINKINVLIQLVSLQTW